MTGHSKDGDISLGASPIGGGPSDILLDKFTIYNWTMTATEMDESRTEDLDDPKFTESTAPEATYSTVGDTVTVTVTTNTEAFVENGAPYATLETGVVDAIAYYTGKTATTITLVATLTAGMRTPDLVWKDANLTLPSGCTMTAGDETAFTLTLPDAGVITNTTIIAIPGTFTIGTGGDVPLWANGSTGFHDLTMDMDGDTFWVMPGGFTDNVVISASNCVMRGYGRSSHVTGELQTTGDDNYIGCVLFSSGWTGNGVGGSVYGDGTYGFGNSNYGGVGSGGSGNTYHPVCSKGKNRMGMNLQ